MKTCELCSKGELKKKKVKDYTYRTPMGAVTVEGSIEFEECQKCKEILIPGKLIDSWNRAILKKMLERKQVLTSRELQFVFSILPYTQSEIAEVTGRERSTLTKYKMGENPVDPLFDHILKRIVSDYLKGRADTMEELRNQMDASYDKEPIRKINVR